MDALSSLADLERAAVGCCLVSTRAAAEAARQLEGWELTDQTAREVFAAVRTLAAADLPIDQVTVADALAAARRLPLIGGAGALEQLASFALAAGDPSHLASYLATIRQRARLRRMTLVAERIAQLSSRQDDPAEALARAARLMEEAISETTRGLRHTMADVAATSDAWLLARATGRPAGLSTGFAALDRMIGGMRPGQLLLLAGRAKMGKSAVAGHIARHVAAAGTPVLIATMEMWPWQWQVRWVAASTGIGYARLMTEQLSDVETALARSALRELERLTIHFLDDRSLSLMDLRAEAQALRREDGLGLVIVDHIALLADVARGADMVRDLGYAAKRLRDLAQKLNVPVLAISQLNRGVELRGSKRPQLHDLRASGELEQDSDVVVFCYRDSYYFPAGTPIDAETGEVARTQTRRIYHVDAKVAELIVAANRDGPPGSAAIYFNPESMVLGDLTGAPDPAGGA